jgi:hypothetical protein
LKAPELVDGPTQIARHIHPQRRAIPHGLLGNDCPAVFRQQHQLLRSAGADNTQVQIVGFGGSAHFLQCLCKSDYGVQVVGADFGSQVAGVDRSRNFFPSHVFELIQPRSAVDYHRHKRICCISTTPQNLYLDQLQSHCHNRWLA